jgi:hypothetical protein
MKRRTPIATALAQSRDELELVRLARRGDLETVEGFVIEVGPEWVLLSCLDPAIRLDGHTAVRRDDVSKVRRPSTGDFVRRALELRGEWPPAGPAFPVDLTDARTLLRSLHGSAPLVTVHAEHDDPDQCLIGAIDGLGTRTLRLREVTPRAVWTVASTRQRIDRITRVDVGGAYEQALLDVAGPTPD